MLKRALVGLGIAALLVMAYVSSYLCVWFMVGAGLVPQRLAIATLDNIFYPVHWYAESYLPGGATLATLRDYLCAVGEGDPDPFRFYAPR